MRVPRANLEFLNLDAAEYRPYAPEPFDLAMCLGASWIYQGYRGTLVALKNMVRPDGLVMVGEPYWLKEPSEDYLASEDITEKTFNTHHGNVIAGEKEGLSFLYAVVSKPGRLRPVRRTSVVRRSRVRPHQSRRPGRS